MSNDIFNQISGLIAQKSCSGVSKDAAEWSVFLNSIPRQNPEKSVSQPAPPPETPRAEKVLPVPEQPRNIEKPAPLIPQETPVTSPAPVVQQGSLDALWKSVGMCRRCRLAETRNNIVFGEGDPNARLMFIGEAPGADEDLSGRPFVGRAGQLLDKMISAMQFSREEVYIANIIKCRPPNNRNPETDEAACCIPYLEEQIKLVKPECIVLLGAIATRFLLNHEGSLSKVRGTWQTYKDIPVMVTYHPSFLLRLESAKREAWQDLQKVMAKFGKFHKK